MLIGGAFCFLYCTLIDRKTMKEVNHVPNTSSRSISGVPGSLYRLKDTDNSPGYFFIISDLYVWVEGDFSIRFTLFKDDEYLFLIQW